MISFYNLKSFCGRGKQENVSFFLFTVNMEVNTFIIHKCYDKLIANMMELKSTRILKTGQCNSFAVNPEQTNAMDAECSLISEPNSK